MMNISSATLNAIIQLKENMTTGVLMMLPTVLDTETQNMVINLMSDLTQGGGKFNNLLKTNIARSIATLIKKQTAAPSSSSSFSPLMMPGVQTMPNAQMIPGAQTMGGMLEEIPNAWKTSKEVNFFTLWISKFEENNM